VLQPNAMMRVMQPLQNWKGKEERVRTQNTGKNLRCTGVNFVSATNLQVIKKSALFYLKSKPE
jgi:hypothetical protein